MDNRMLKAALDEQVTGHEEAKKALIVMLARSELRTHQRWVRQMSDEHLIAPLKILLIGKSGTGKSHLVHTLTQITNKPVIKVDATHLIPTGAGSGIKPEKLAEMIHEAVLNKCKEFPYSFPYVQTTLDQAIVVIDEIDKLGAAFEGSGNWNKHVQSSFLTLFDSKDEFSGVSFVFMGAFDEITGNKESPKSIGFQHNNIEKANKSELEDMVVKSGLIPELVGRMNAIIELDTFTKEDYANILQERILPKKERDLAAMGIFGEIVPFDTQMKLAERAEKSGQGVRFLQREVDKMFLDLEFDADRDDSVMILGESE